MSSKAFSAVPPSDLDPDGKLLRLQKRFLRAFPWLRRSSGKTQREVAELTGWKQPYVARLEDERSPLIMAMARIERYAQACGATGILTFHDKKSGEVRRAMAFGDDGVRMVVPHSDLVAASHVGVVPYDDPRVVVESIFGAEGNVVIDPLGHKKPSPMPRRRFGVAQDDYVRMPEERKSDDGDLDQPIADDRPLVRR